MTGTEVKYKLQKSSMNSRDKALKSVESPKLSSEQLRMMYPNHEGPLGDELKKLADEIVKQMVENLNENARVGNPRVRCGRSTRQMSHSDQNQGFSEAGLKEVEKMVKLGYHRLALIPGSDGMPVFDRELGEELHFQDKQQKKA